MNHKRTAVARAFLCGVALIVAGMLLAGSVPSIAAQAQPQAAKGAIQFDVATGTKASFRAREQFVGINFPTDAVGTTEACAGTLVFAPDGSIDSSQSKLTVDLRTLKSDQDLRDNYIKMQTLQAEKFPFATFVPRRVQGIPSPFPTTGTVGLQLVGDLTIHGTTNEVTWMGYAAFTGDQAGGRVTTTFTFAMFGLNKPKVTRLLSVDDNLQLEVEFRMKKSAGS